MTTKTTTTKRTLTPSRKALKVAKQNFWAAVACCTVAIVLTGLSLTDLANGFQIVTKCPGWQAWSLAIGIDCGFISFETALMVAPTKAIRDRRSTWATPAVIGLMTGSALFNAVAFSANADGYYVYVAWGLGVAIPAVIFAMTKIAGDMLLEQRTK